MESWHFITTALGGSAILVAALAWLSRKIISHFLDKDVEVFTAKLQAEANKELAQIRSTLELAAFEHQTRFSKLHEKRAKIISELYSAIYELEKSVKYFIDSAPIATNEDNKESANLVWQAAGFFKSFFGKNRIFLSEDVCQKIEELNKVMSEAFSSLVTSIQLSNDKPDWMALSEIWLKAQAKMDGEFPEIKKELEAEFRELLGVIQPNIKE